jgi:hypothetical protein
VEALGLSTQSLTVPSFGGLHNPILTTQSRATDTQVGRVLDAVAPNAVTSVLLLSASLVLVHSGRAGLYVLIAPVLVALTGGVINA